MVRIGDTLGANQGAGMASNRFTRREVVAAVPLVLAAPTLLRAQPLLDKVPALDKVWRFLVVGDWGRDGREGQQETANAMAEVWDKYGAEFVVSTGDNFYNWGVRSASDHRWNTCFEHVYAKRIAPWYGVLGNHDYGGSVQAQIDRGKQGGRWKMDRRWGRRSLTQAGRPPLDLFFFDTVAWHGKEKLPHSLQGAKVSRADRDLQIAEMDPLLRDSTAELKIAFGHHGVWSVGPHGGKRDLVDLDDRLRKAKVKAWVHGHDHCLFHIQQGAMNYICSGAGSKVLADHRMPGACPAVGCGELGPVEEKSYYDAAPGQNHIDGGFALFELGQDTGSFTFFNSQALPLGAGAVKLY